MIDGSVQAKSQATKSGVPEGWRGVVLGEVCKKMYSGGTPSTKREEYYNGEIPWIRTQEVDFNYINETEIKITDKGLSNSSAKWIPEDTVIIAMYGNSAGRVAYSRIKATTNQACCNFVADRKKVDPVFIFHNLRSRYAEIAGKANGAAQQNLSVGVLKELDVILPPVEEQKAIAGVLSAFDDKIELLREQNQTLEQTAQTIFNEWFGKYSPDEPQNLPSGWRVGRLGEEFEIKIGRTPPRKEPQWFSLDSKHIKWISIKDIVNSGMFIAHTSEYLTKEAVNKFNIPIIAEGTVIMSFKMTVGKIAITTETMLSNEAIAQMGSKSGGLSSWFIYCYLKGIDFNSLGSTSSIVTAINSKIIKELDILVPNSDILQQFDNVVQSIFEKIRDNSQQIQTLTKTRDTLLPKLMTGEVRA